ncbi:2Fe-2S iron-sulfur cluster-binding protein [Bradyrhizobium manausense]
MEAAVGNAVPGILAECGGNAMCATCHVYVDEGWSGCLEEIEELEDELLTGVSADRRATSRLSCQIRMTAALDGLILRVPDKQV